MRGNTFGKMFSITSFGESHGKALGVVIDGVPSGLNFDLESLQRDLDRRAPGQSKGVTARKEADKAIVLSGVYENKTLGSPIAIIVENTNQRSEDYRDLKEEYRPGHADKTTMLKYGIRDHRGGGRSSGRETLARVIGGYFAKLILPQVKVKGHISKLGPFEYNDIPKNLESDFAPYGFPLTEKNKEIEDYLVNLKNQGESIGGKVRLIIQNVPTGLGEPAFDKLKADLAKAILSIGACVGFSYGIGEGFANLLGNDVNKYPEAFGGIEGGISNGSPIILNVIIKPTSTVGEKAKLGRHDPCIIPRAIPVMEAMAMMTLADHFLRQNAYQYDKI